MRCSNWRNGFNNLSRIDFALSRGALSFLYNISSTVSKSQRIDFLFFDVCCSLQ